jgi:hypothetical protein
MGPEILGAVAEKELTQAFGRVLGGPASELGAYIADKVRALRYKSLLRIVENAEKQAKEKDLQLKMPPIKFFVPFCESASLEDEADVTSGSLSDLWTNLLLSASTQYDPRHLMFLRVLKELTANEARFMDLIVNHSRASTDLRPISSPGYEDAPYLNVNALDAFLSRAEPSTSADTLLEFAVDCLECPGIRFLDGNLSPIDENGYPNHAEGFGAGFHNIDRPNSDIAMNVLEGLNLGEIVYLDDVRFRAYNNYTLGLTYFRLSELGVALLQACNFCFNGKVFDQVIEEPKRQSDNAKDPSEE